MGPLKGYHQKTTLSCNPRKSMWILMMLHPQKLSVSLSLSLSWYFHEGKKIGRKKWKSTKTLIWHHYLERKWERKDNEKDKASKGCRFVGSIICDIQLERGLHLINIITWMNISLNLVLERERKRACGSEN